MPTTWRREWMDLNAYDFLWELDISDLPKLVAGLMGLLPDGDQPSADQISHNP